MLKTSSVPIDLGSCSSKAEITVRQQNPRFTCHRSPPNWWPGSQDVEDDKDRPSYHADTFKILAMLPRLGEVQLLEAGSTAEDELATQQSVHGNLNDELPQNGILFDLGGAGPAGALTNR